MKSLARINDMLRWHSSKLLAETIDRRLRPDETISSIRTRNPAEFDQMLEVVRSAGTASIQVCGDDYSEEGGLRLQQRTNEFAALLIFLRRCNLHGAYLEIGTASGGATRLIQDQIHSQQVLSIDDGEHPDAYLQAKNLALIPNLVQHTGDSHDPAAVVFIRKELVTPLVVAYIDGDHSYEGVRQDTRMLLPFTQPGTLLVYHDTVAVPEVRRYWREAGAGGLFRPAAHFVDDRPGALGISVAVVTADRRPVRALRNLL